MLEIVLIKEEELKRIEDWGNNSVGTLCASMATWLQTLSIHIKAALKSLHVGQGQEDPGDPAGQSV